MKKTELKINIYDPEKIFESIGSSEIFKDEETMCLHLYDVQGKETGHIDISDILKLMIQLV